MQDGANISWLAPSLAGRKKILLPTIFLLSSCYIFKLPFATAKAAADTSSSKCLIFFSPICFKFKLADLCPHALHVLHMSRFFHVNLQLQNKNLLKSFFLKSKLKKNKIYLTIFILKANILYSDCFRVMRNNSTLMENVLFTKRHNKVAIRLFVT